ncbi:hypothetical protein Tco_0624993 [Tanacetum coccineum]|uniref:Uncharacterized protein n=1 Tax=Tanacetum coccineum TaxID=301880 RepID=A0ABQ4WFI4_9ASTR
MCDKNYHHSCPAHRRKDAKRHKKSRNRPNSTAVESHECIYGRRVRIKIRSREESHYSESKKTHQPLEQNPEGTEAAKRTKVEARRRQQKGTPSRTTSQYSESEDSEGGHWKSKSRRQRSNTYEDDLSQPWTCEERNPSHLGSRILVSRGLGCPTMSKHTMEVEISEEIT